MGAARASRPIGAARATLAGSLLAAVLLFGCSTTTDKGVARHAETEAPLPPGAAGLTFPLDPPPMTRLQAVRAFPNVTFERPVLLTVAPGQPDRLYVLEQAGRISILPANGDADHAETFLDIRERVLREGNEEGLLGLTFAPDFPQSGVFYLFYSANNPRRSQVSRFKTDAQGQGDPNSEEPILGVEQPFSNHNGGTVVFGPDGHLYAGFGDGGKARDPFDHGQNLATLLGTIVRLKVGSVGPYQIPADNPFVGVAGARPEIFAYGLRNPWRFSFAPDGRLWAGDVGQDRLEEIDIVEAGGNYGWRLVEATHDFHPDPAATDRKLIAPIVEYGRRFGESVTGGVVYHGRALPDFAGAYFYGDYISGNVWALRESNGRMTANEIVARVPELSSFGEDANGELYGVSLLGGLYRFEPGTPAGNVPGFPMRLSQTGAFADVVALEPTEALIPYTPTVELWSDGARKQRWMVLPDGQQIVFAPEGPWTFPVGTVLVKHFELPLDDADPTKVRRLETRFMVHETAGWSGYTYRWNDEQTDATLLRTDEDAMFEVRRGGRTQEQVWTFPGGPDCLQCHSESYGRVLGLRTRQLHRPDDDVVAEWAQRQFFANPPTDLAALASHPVLDDENASLERRARAYLDVNCALCHNATRPSSARFDVRVEAVLGDALLVGVPPGDPMGLPEEQRIHPGKHASSSIWARMVTFGPEHMMPLATHVVDDRAQTLIARWIDEMR